MNETGKGKTPAGKIQQVLGLVCSAAVLVVLGLRIGGVLDGLTAMLAAAPLVSVILILQVIRDRKEHTAVALAELCTALFLIILTIVKVWPGN
ncbi:MAG: hypothetical protein ACOX7F_01520 [Eubacteriales bacterium]|jgi:hypothetical protein